MEGSTTLAEPFGQEARQAGSKDLLPGSCYIVSDANEFDGVRLVVADGKTCTLVAIAWLTDAADVHQVATVSGQRQMS